MTLVIPRSSATPGERDLTEKEQRLIEAIVHAASRGATITREQAGTAAGYGRGEIARIQASRALQRPVVRAALMQALQEAAQVDVAGSLAVLRHLERKAKSERVRLDAALGGLRIGGLDAQQQANNGPGVAIQIVFKTDAGALLAQPQPMTLEGKADQGLEQVEHALDEGEGERQAPARRSKRTPPPGQTQDAEARPGVKTRARPPAAGSPARRAPGKSWGKKSGGVDG